MRALLQSRPVSSKSRIFAVAVILVAVAVGVFAYTANPRTARANVGGPVITSLVLTQVVSGVWQVSGTISCPEGYSGMQLHFGGSLIDENGIVESDGSFEEVYGMNPGPFDWIEAVATDRWEQESEMVVHYF